MNRQLSTTAVMAILKKAEQQQDERACELPTLDHCLVAMSQILQRLRELGWKDADCAPRDRSFLGLFAGSTQPVRCVFLGGGGGSFFCEDNGDLWPVRVLMWRELPKGRKNDSVRWS